MAHKDRPQTQEYGQDDTAFADRMLASLAHETVPPGLEARILADFDAVTARRKTSWLQRLAGLLGPGTPAWQPAAAFALSLLCGLFIGASLPAQAVPQTQTAAAGTSVAGAAASDTASNDIPVFDMVRDLQ